jgi:hypothetical protein
VEYRPEVLKPVKNLFSLLFGRVSGSERYEDENEQTPGSNNVSRSAIWETDEIAGAWKKGCDLAGSTGYSTVLGSAQRRSSVAVVVGSRDPVQA